MRVSPDGTFDGTSRRPSFTAPTVTAVGWPTPTNPIASLFARTRRLGYRGLVGCDQEYLTTEEYIAALDENVKKARA